MADFAEFIKHSTRQCKGGAGCMCCREGCDCGCVRSCPVWLKVERARWRYNNPSKIRGRADRYESER